MKALLKMIRVEDLVTAVDRLISPNSFTHDRNIQQQYRRSRSIQRAVNSVLINSQEKVLIIHSLNIMNNHSLIILAAIACLSPTSSHAQTALPPVERPTPQLSALIIDKQPHAGNIALVQQQVEEVVDFGIRRVNEQPSANQKPFKIDVQVPLGHSKFVITPPNPFSMNIHNGQIDASRHGEIDVSLNSSELSVGNHQKVVTILTNQQLIIKRVLLKVKIVPSSTTPGFPNNNDPRQP